MQPRLGSAIGPTHCHSQPQTARKPEQGSPANFPPDFAQALFASSLDPQASDHSWHSVAPPGPSPPVPELQLPTTFGVAWQRLPSLASASPAASPLPSRVVSAAASAPASMQLQAPKVPSAPQRCEPARPSVHVHAASAPATHDALELVSPELPQPTITSTAAITTSFRMRQSVATFAANARSSP